jgi:hypothetical protein
MNHTPTLEYGLASVSRADIETLGRISRRAAEAILTDSRLQWPDAYLVQRENTEPWRRPPAGDAQ